MSARTLTVAVLLLAAGQAAADVWYTNQLNHRIPIDIEPERRAEIREVIAYSSDDEGKTWHKEAVIASDKPDFLFYGRGEGSYWFRVATVNRQGKQDPENLFDGPPQLKMVIDRARPQPRIVTAQRHGDELFVAWEVKEAHPDPASLVLEYAAQDGGPPVWIKVPATPGPSGQARARLNTPSALVVRLQLRDRAGNVGMDTRDVPADGVATTSFTTKQAPPGGQGALPQPPGHKAAPAQEQTAPLPAPPRLADAGSPFPPKSVATGSLNPPGQVPIASTEVNPIPAKPMPAPGLPTPGPDGGGQVIAASDRTSQQPTPPGPAAPAPRALAAVQLVGHREVELEYELKNVGPSGIGNVELYLTQDEGQTWIRFAEDPDAQRATAGGKYARVLELPGEGVYGLSLVVLSQAGRGKPAPRPGDLPEMMLEVDLTPPAAKLFKPEPDPQRRDTLTLSWSAKDRNLGATPITLEWSERRDGPWQPIAADLPNSGKHAWQVPPGTPVHVYLRLRVRDKVGNEGVAVTAEPQLVDLSEPEGRLLTVRPTVRRP